MACVLAALPGNQWLGVVLPGQHRSACRGCPGVSVDRGGGMHRGLDAGPQLSSGMTSAGLGRTVSRPLITAATSGHPRPGRGPMAPPGWHSDRWRRRRRRARAPPRRRRPTEAQRRTLFVPSVFGHASTTAWWNSSVLEPFARPVAIRGPVYVERQAKFGLFAFRLTELPWTL